MGLVSIFGESYITIQNLEITDNIHQLINISYNTGNTTPSTDITVQGCKIHDIYDPVLTYVYSHLVMNGLDAVDGVTRILIDNNEVYSTSHTGRNGIQLCRGASHITISNNIVHGIIHGSINPLNNTEDVEIFGNTIYDVGSGGIAGSDMVRFNIYNNVIYDDTANVLSQAYNSGVGVESSNGRSSYVVARNNAVSGIKGLSTSLGFYIEGCDNCTLYNNTVYDSRNICFLSDNPSLLNQNNLYYGNTSGGNCSNYGSDPLFVNVVSTPPNLHLQSGSPVINQGVDVGLPYSGVAPDLGAYEYLLESFSGGTFSGGTRQ